MSEITFTITELAAFLTQLGIIAAFFFAIYKWINKHIKSIEKLTKSVYDDDGNERYVTRAAYDASQANILAKLDKIMAAVNLMNDVQLVALDAQISACTDSDTRIVLMAERKKLNERRGIV